MTKFWATYKMIGADCLATVSKATPDGLAWIGSFRRESYDACFEAVDQHCESLGGRLERFAAEEPKRPARHFSHHAKHCASRITPDLPRRPVNGLNCEVAQPQDRCMSQPPVNSAGIVGSSIRWIGSGGSPLALGICCAAKCPLRK